MNKYLVKMSHTSRDGSIEGLFTVNSEEFEYAQTTNPIVHFDGTFGKHNCLSVNFNDIDFEIMEDDMNKIAVFESVMGHGTMVGYNPFDYIEV